MLRWERVVTIEGFGDVEELRRKMWRRWWLWSYECAVGVGGGMTSRQLCTVPYYGNSRPPEPKIRVQYSAAAMPILGKGRQDRAAATSDAELVY